MELGRNITKPQKSIKHLAGLKKATGTRSPGGILRSPAALRASVAVSLRNWIDNDDETA
jgi:hypothetical protein